jgi:HAD superfamily hydrolase (TIGR01490 family)
MMIGVKKKIAVFDIDGTLTSAHLGVEFLKEMATLGAICGINRSLFLKQYDEWAHSKDRTAYYDTHFDDYYTSRLVGVKKEVFEEAARKVAISTFPHFYKQIVAELKNIQATGRYMMVVSKSPEQAVAEIAKLLGVDEHWGWRFNFDDSGRYVDQFTYSKGESDKAYIIQQVVIVHDLTLEDSIAYGDSNGDISMLKFVQNPTAVNPEPKLLAVAKANSWRIIQTVEA